MSSDGVTIYPKTESHVSLAPDAIAAKKDIQSFSIVSKKPRYLIFTILENANMEICTKNVYI